MIGVRGAKHLIDDLLAMTRNPSVSSLFGDGCVRFHFAGIRRELQSPYSEYAPARPGSRRRLAAGLTAEA